MAAETLRELAHGEVFALGEIDRALLAALRGVALWNVRQRPIWIEFRRVVAERDRQRANGVCVVHEAVELRPLGARLLHGIADDDEAAGKDFQMVARASGFFRPAFHVGIKLLPHSEARLRSEHRFRRFGRKLAAGFRGAGLDDDRPTLDGPRDVQRAAHRQVFAPVVEHMQLVGIEIKAVFDIADERIIGPAVPQTGHDIVKLARASVTLAVLHMLFHPEIQRRIRIGSGDDVPASAPATEMVERGEAPRDVIGGVEGGGAGGDKADALGHLG